jgi:hypothetical protein
MARIVYPLVRKRGAPQKGGRYCFDEDMLLAHFGGRERLAELTGQYGVPPLPVVIRKRKSWNRDLDLNHYIPVLLELAERMHRPLDLYQFVVELR